MTRENKLALVVGFALILFVGILISDHFSVVRQQEAANLGSGQIVDPTLVANRSGADLIDLLATNVSSTGDPNARMNGRVNPPLPPMPPMQASSGSPSTGSSSLPTGSEPVTTTPSSARAEANVPGFRPVPAEQEIPLADVKFHEVRGGETLMSICRQHYSDSNLANALAKYNKIDDPRTMKAGRRLMIPEATALGAKPQSSPPSSAVAGSSSSTPKPEPKKSKTYTIKEGESLASIANRVYGSRSKWTRIYEQNRDVIDDPDNVRVGTVIKL